MNRTKVALITGAGRRLGRQIAYALSHADFHIVVNYYRSKKEAMATVETIKRSGKAAIAVKADVSSKRQVNRMVLKAIKSFRSIDLLINNSAIFYYSPLPKTSERTWNRTLDVNLKGTFLCSQAAAKIMLRSGEGRIINIASVGGIQAWPDYLPYSVSKAGVIMLTKCLAKALAPNIMVNAIAPGTIIIPNEEKPNQKHIPLSRIPLQRYGHPDDIVNTVLFLATTTTYITGQVFVVDGGRAT